MRVAQLDRAFDYGSKGREFESSRARFLWIAPMPINTGLRGFSYARILWTTPDHSAYFLDYFTFELFISSSVFDICPGLFCGCVSHPFTQSFKIYVMLIAIGSNALESLENELSYL